VRVVIGIQEEAKSYNQSKGGLGAQLGKPAQLDDQGSCRGIWIGRRGLQDVAFRQRQIGLTPHWARNSAVASRRCGLRVGSLLEPGGTQTTKPRRALVKRTRYLLRMYCAQPISLEKSNGRR
jgi:hypothetical protein